MTEYAAALAIRIKDMDTGELVARNQPLADIARILGRSEEAVYTRASKEHGYSRKNGYLYKETDPAKLEAFNREVLARLDRIEAGLEKLLAHRKRPEPVIFKGLDDAGEKS